MSMISEQVKCLRELSKKNHQGCGFVELDGALRQAADTIEALSAKLSAANMEWSEAYYGGGFIYCGDGNNLPEEEGAYITTRNVHDIWTNECLRKDIKIVAFLNGKWIQKPQYDVIAWQPLPQPYQRE